MTARPDDSGNVSNSSTSLSYKDAGVDIDAGNALVEKIKAVTLRTNRPEVLSGLGGFGALCEIPAGYRNPVLVSATDGVGTKLKLAIDLGIHDTIGIDLVAMCVNDLIVCGAEPLFFLDYYASGKLDVDVAIRVIEGIGTGCQLAGCALIGGETAEMPGVYQHKDYDLAGFSVGIVEKSEIISPDEVQIGDKLIGLASSGPHSNGYSLIRKIIAHCGASLADEFGDSTLGEVLLTPTQIYVKAIQSVRKSVKIKALAHITGGGILENLPRVLPANTRAEINLQSWPQPPIFQWLKEKGNIQEQEMYRTFNCGIGMVLCVSSQDCEDTLEVLNNCTLGAYEIGCVKECKNGAQVSLLNQAGSVPV